MKPIEKNIPIPERAEYNRDGLANRMRQMQIGDSFLCESKGEYGMVYTLARYVGIKIKARKTPEGHRVWRVKANGKV